jgi:hypothetical protein
MANWKDVVRNVAPALGTALLGPAAGVALRVVSTALLGKPDASEAEIEARIANWTPADELALKAAEQQFALALVDRVVALEAVDAGDRANARAREVAVKDWVPRVLALGVFGLFSAALILMHYHTIPSENRETSMQLLEILKMSTVLVLGYYFGSSSGSASARTMLGRLAEGKK